MSMKHKYQRLWFITAILLLLQTIAFAQNSLTISGTVKDKATGEGLPAVSIAVKGKSTGTVSDAKGRFFLKLNTPPPVTLVVSSVGYKAFEFTVSSSSADMSIELET